MNGLGDRGSFEGLFHDQVEKLRRMAGRKARVRSGTPTRGPLASLLRRETASRLAIAPLLDVSPVGARGLAHRAEQVLRQKLPANFALPGDRWATY